MKILVLADEDYKYCTWSLQRELQLRGFDIIVAFDKDKQAVFPELLNSDSLILVATVSSFLQSHQANDYIRQVIETAHNSKIPIISLLFEDSFETPLYKKYLHESIKFISKLPSIKLDFDNWESTINSLIRLLSQSEVHGQGLSNLPELSDESLTIGRRAESFFETGSRKYLEGEIEKAKENFDTAIKLQTDFASAYNNRALARRRLKDLHGALKDIDTAIRLKPKESTHYINRALIHSDLGEFQLALADCTKAIALKPDSAVAYHNRATVLENINLKQDALDDYTKALELDNTVSFTYINRGKLLEELGMVEEAIADYSHVINLNPKDVDSLHRRAKLFAKSGETESALADFTNAIALTPSQQTLMQLYRERAEIYNLMKDYEKATKDIQAGLQLRPLIKDRQKGIEYLTAMANLVQQQPDSRIGLIQTVVAGTDPLYDSVEKYLKSQAEALGFALTTYHHSAAGSMLIFSNSDYWLLIAYERGQVSCDIGHNDNPMGKRLYDDYYELPSVLSFLGEYFQYALIAPIEEQVERISYKLLQDWNALFTDALLVARRDELRQFIVKRRNKK